MFDLSPYIIFAIGLFLGALSMFLAIGILQLCLEEKRNKEKLQSYSILENWDNSKKSIKTNNNKP